MKFNPVESNLKASSQGSHHGFQKCPVLCLCHRKPQSQLLVPAAFQGKINEEQYSQGSQHFLKQDVFILLSFLIIRLRKQALVLLPPAYDNKQLKTLCEINNGNGTEV